LMNRRSIHLIKQEECRKKIRDLGSLPSDAFEAYRIPTLALYFPCLLDLSL
jgi:hypothetical protein